MNCAIRMKSFTSLALMISVGALFLLSLSFSRSVGVRASQAGCASCQEDANKPHLLATSYYSVRDNLKAILMLNNKGPCQLEVKPTLFSLSGQRLDLPPVTVEGNTFREIDLREFGIAGTPFEEGSLQLFHRGKDLVLGAQVRLVDEARSLVFEEKLLEVATEIGYQRLEGVWWVSSPQSEVKLVVSNTSDAFLPVAARVDGSAPKQKDQFSLTLAPHETRVLDVQRDIVGKRGGILAEAGGITLEHTGDKGALLSRMLIQDASAGYSMSSRFFDPQKAKSSAMHGAGLRLGSVAGEKLTPMIVARNVGSSPTVLTGRIPYTLNDGTMSAVSLPNIRLDPGEARIVDAAGALKRSKVEQNIATAGLEFEYSTEPGSVIMAAQSVSKSANQVFQVPLWDIAAQRSSTGGYPWSADGDTTTIVYIKNTTDRHQEYVLQLNFPGGVYAPGLKTVEAGQTVTLDVRQLRDNRVPDANGKTIPMHATSGQIMWSQRSAGNLSLIGRSERVDINKGISNSYACQNPCPNTYYSGWLDPGGADVWIGFSTQFVAMEQDQSSYGYVFQPYQVYPGSWNSSNWSVASVSGGSAYGLAEGEASITGTWDAPFREGEVGGGECALVYRAVSADASAFVDLPPRVTLTSVDFTANPVARQNGATTLRANISSTRATPANTTATVEIQQETNSSGVAIEVTTFEKTVSISSGGSVVVVTFPLTTTSINQNSGTVTYRATITAASHPSVSVQIGMPNSAVSMPALTVQ